MSVLYIAIPTALCLAGFFVWGFYRAIREGQFDDLDSPPRRMLFDDKD